MGITAFEPPTSDGYYILNDSENVSSGLLEDSNETASIYCGQSSASEKSPLCFSDNQGE